MNGRPLAPTLSPITPGPVLFGSALLDGVLLEDLIDTIGSEDFGASFFEYFDSVLGLEQCTVFSFDGDMPEKLLAQGKTTESDRLAKTLADMYVGGGYKNDPNFAAFGQVGATGVLIYRIERDAFDDPEYRRCFYDDADLAHEIVILYRMPSRSVYLGLYRNPTQGCFDGTEMQAAREIAGIAIKALGQHVSFCRRSGAPTASHRKTPPKDLIALVGHLKEVFLKESAGLSMREAEVIAHICVGYSSYATASTLGITAHTVATHRKRAYAKLRVCSQNQLFSRYLHNVIGIAI